MYWFNVDQFINTVTIRSPSHRFYHTNHRVIDSITPITESSIRSHQSPSHRFDHTNHRVIDSIIESSIRSPSHRFDHTNHRVIDSITESSIQSHQSPSHRFNHTNHQLINSISLIHVVFYYPRVISLDRSQASNRTKLMVWYCSTCLSIQNNKKTRRQICF